MKTEGVGENERIGNYKRLMVCGSVKNPRKSKETQETQEAQDFLSFRPLPTSARHPTPASLVVVGPWYIIMHENTKAEIFKTQRPEMFNIFKFAIFAVL